MNAPAKIPSSKNGKIHNIKKLDAKRLASRMRMITYRLPVYIWLEKSKTPMHSFAFIADFAEDGIGIYLEKKIKALNFVRIAFENEEATSFNGKIMWCDRFALEQRYIGGSALKFRAGVKFIFSAESERKKYLDYFNEVQGRMKYLSGEEDIPKAA